MGRFVVDFFCAEHALVVEIDGAAHGGQEDVDAERQRLLELSGVRVERFSASDVETRLEEVLAALRSLISGSAAAPGKPSENSPARLTAGGHHDS